MELPTWKGAYCPRHVNPLSVRLFNHARGEWSWPTSTPPPLAKQSHVHFPKWVVSQKKFILCSSLSEKSTKNYSVIILFLLLSAQYLWRLYIWYALNQNARQSYHWKYLGSNFSRLVQNVGMQMPSEEREKEMKQKRRTLDLFLHHLLVSKVKGNHWHPSEKMILAPKRVCYPKKVIKKRKLEH